MHPLLKQTLTDDLGHINAMLTPLSLLFGLLLGTLAFAFPLFGILLLYRALRQPKPAVIDRDRRGVDAYRTTGHSHPVRHSTWKERLREPSAYIPLIAGTLLLVLTFTGGHLIKLAFPVGQDEPSDLHGTAKEVPRSDGTKIHVEFYGPTDGPTLILTHGWGTNSAEWYYAKRQLSQRFRLIVWDLPGLGESQQPLDRDYALEKMAVDLHAVVALASGKPVILIGHSIGGMINLTFARLYPDLLGTQVAGMVQLDTSYTNPVRTTKNSGVSLAIQKPIAEPLLHAMIGLSPLVHAANWLSYQEGLTYLRNAQSSFAGAETRGQIDLLSRSQADAIPAVVARGTLAMFHWDATPVLQQVKIPVLVIVGQEDTTTLPSASETMHNLIALSNLHTVHPGAHYALLEQNGSVNTDIARFASSILK